MIISMKNIIIILALFSAFNLYCEEEEEKPIMYFGLNGGLNYNVHVADFKSLPNTPNCCPKFETSFLHGFNGGMFLDIPISEKWELGFSSNYINTPFEFSTIENIGNTGIIGNNGSTVPEKVFAEYKLDGTVNSVSLETYITYYINKNFRLNFGVKPSYIVQNFFNQIEVITEPQNVTFVGGDLFRNRYQGEEISEISKFQFGISLGASYILEQTKNWAIIPHLKYNHSFTNIATDNWVVNGVDVGLSIRYSVIPAKVLPIIRDTTYIIDTTQTFVFHIDEPQIRLLDSIYKVKIEEFDDRIEEKYIYTKLYEKQTLKTGAIDIDLKLVGIDQDGTIMEVPTIIIEETEYGEGFPILPYIYFEANSSDLSKSNQILLNKSDINNFNSKKLDWNAFKINDNTLNILAQRIQQTNAIIKVNGYYTITEKKSIANQRANSVVDYLVSVWGIDESRFLIKSKKQKITSKKSKEDKLKAEYQRVEILSDDLSLIKPLILNEIKKTSNPPKIRINGNIYAETGLNDWKVNINQDGNPFRFYQGNDTSFSKDWLITKEPIPQLEKPISVVLTALDKMDNSRTKEEKISIEQLTIKKKRIILKDDKIFERFSLIVFDYNKSTLNKIQNNVIRDIRKNIKSNSFVTIEGYADASGSAEYNKLLSHRRTLAVKKALDKKAAGYKLVPYGSSVQLFDNATPKGRALNRTVIITIETPVEE